jgi:hypothetical protein
MGRTIDSGVGWRPDLRELQRLFHGAAQAKVETGRRGGWSESLCRACAFHNMTTGRCRGWCAETRYFEPNFHARRLGPRVRQWDFSQIRAVTTLALAAVQHQTDGTDGKLVSGSRPVASGPNAYRRRRKSGKRRTHIVCQAKQVLAAACGQRRARSSLKRSETVRQQKAGLLLGRRNVADIVSFDRQNNPRGSSQRGVWNSRRVCVRVRARTCVCVRVIDISHYSRQSLSICGDHVNK